MKAGSSQKDHTNVYCLNPRFIPAGLSYLFFLVHSTIPCLHNLTLSICLISSGSVTHSNRDGKSNDVRLHTDLGLGTPPPPKCDSGDIFAL